MNKARESAQLDALPQFIFEQCFTVTDAAALQSAAVAIHTGGGQTLESRAELVDIFGEPGTPTPEQMADALKVLLDAAGLAIVTPGAIQQDSHVAALDAKPAPPPERWMNPAAFDAAHENRGNQVSPPSPLSPAQYDALVSAVAAADEDLDHWRHNGDALDKEAQEERAAELQEAHAALAILKG